MGETEKPANEHPDPSTVPSAERPPSRRRRKWPWLVLLGILIIPSAIIALWSWITLSYTYSEGERAGYVQKFSRKGWVCKTWEGELAMTTVPGVAPTIWEFTVRDKAAAHQLNLALGRRVILFYREHRGIPSRCFGETNYFVDSARIVK